MNVFNVPTGLATFQLTQNAAQRNLDALQRPSRETPGNQIIANRLTGEDGWTLDTLSIDPVWLRDFADCPSYMRQYISLVAARKYLGSAEEIPGFTAEDEQRALLEVHRAERQIAPVTTGTARTTEVEAVNSILDTAGLAPVGSLDSILTPEASRATNLLREAVRELCTEGWEFNTEHGYEITSADSYEWTNSFNETYTLNVFTVPADLLNFDITTVDFQQGPYYLDLAARQSREYTDAQGDAVQLFADRATNRDGHLNRDAIYINPVWLFPFDQLPEEARRFAVVLATRRFAGDRSPFNRRDELIARRTLQRAYGTKDAYTLLDNQSVRRILGGRSPGPAGAYDRRATGG